LWQVEMSKASDKVAYLASNVDQRLHMQGSCGINRGSYFNPSGRRMC